MVVAHGESQYSLQIRFVDITQLSQVCEGDIAIDGDLSGNVEFVDSLETCCIILGAEVRAFMTACSSRCDFRLRED